MCETVDSEPTEPNAKSSAAATVAEILKELKVLRNGPADEPSSEMSTADAFLAVVSDPVHASFCVARLFPNDLPVDQSFFHRLDEFRRWIGVGESGDEGIGIVWSEAMRRLSADDKVKLLNVFVSRRGYDFFRNVGSLPIVLKNHAFPPDFLADWFTDLVRIIANDVGTDVWKSLSTLCESNTDCAFEVLWKLIRSFEDRRLSIARVMLGTIRILHLNDKQASEFKRLEEFLQHHSDERLRSVFIWSWTTTARNKGIAISELSALFAKANSGTSADLGNVVSVVCCICANDSLPREIFDSCTDWIGGQVSPSLPTVAKYHIANAAARLLGKCPSNAVPQVDCSVWIVGRDITQSCGRGCS